MLLHNPTLLTFRISWLVQAGTNILSWTDPRVHTQCLITFPPDMEDSAKTKAHQQSRTILLIWTKNVPQICSCAFDKCVWTRDGIDVISGTPPTLRHREANNVNLLEAKDMINNKLTCFHVVRIWCEYTRMRCYEALPTATPHHLKHHHYFGSAPEPEALWVPVQQVYSVQG